LLLRFPNVASWKITGDVIAKRGRVIRGLETLPMRLGEADANC
jgi:predicted RNA-binding protein YlqC (UPF0109 family)